MIASTSKPMQVVSDHDMIMLRQAVRQAAREVGLSAAQQARFTAAVSEVARALIGDAGESAFTIRLSEPPERSALEVRCDIAHGRHSSEPGFYNAPNIAGARTLVDEAQVDITAPCPRLMLRMWIDH